MVLCTPPGSTPPARDAGSTAMTSARNWPDKARFIEELKKHDIIVRGNFMFEDGVKLDYKVDFGKKCPWPACSVLGEELGKVVSAVVPEFQPQEDFCNYALIETASRIHPCSPLSYLWTGTPPGVNVFPLDELEVDRDRIDLHSQVLLFEDVLTTGTRLVDLVADEIEPFMDRVAGVIIGFDHQLGGEYRIQREFPGIQVHVIMSVNDLNQSSGDSPE